MAKVGIWFPGKFTRKREREERPKGLHLKRPLQIRVRFPWQKNNLDYYEWPHVWSVTLTTEDCFGNEQLLKTWYFTNKQSAYDFYADKYQECRFFFPYFMPFLNFEGACHRLDHLRDEAWDAMRKAHDEFEAGRKKEDYDD